MNKISKHIFLSQKTFLQYRVYSTEFLLTCGKALYKK